MDHRRPPPSSSVSLDPALALGLSVPQRRAAEVCVLRARADGLRGPRRGERGLALALRAADLEQALADLLGAAAALDLIEAAEAYPVTRAAIERWQVAEELAHRVLGPRTTD